MPLGRLAAAKVITTDIRVKPSRKRKEQGEPVLVPKYGMHALRHFFASRIIQPREAGGLGYTAKRAQVVLGHSSITMTLDTYGHLLPDETTDWAAMQRAETALLATRWHKDGTSRRFGPWLTEQAIENKASARSSAG